MKRPLRKCAAAGCTWFAAFEYCSRHRRQMLGHTLSTAERARRIAEERAERERDPLAHTAEGRTA